jgi:hypothetical protein
MNAGEPDDSTQRKRALPTPKRERVGFERLHVHLTA